MAKTRNELDRMLEKLEDNLPKLIQETDETNVMKAFAGEAEVIRGAANRKDRSQVDGRIHCMLSSRGLILARMKANLASDEVPRRQVRPGERVAKFFHKESAMKTTRKALLISATMLLGMNAQANSSDPAGATAVCKDGKYSHEAKAIACTLHGGIKTWMGDKGTGPIVSGTRAAPAAGAAGVVWVNTRSKHYHCSNDVWYGKTRKGAYMYEDDAKAQGYKPDHKACG